MSSSALTKRADGHVEHDNERSEASGRFPCPSDVTRHPFVLTLLGQVGRASITHTTITDPFKFWYDMGETEVLIDEWGEIFFERARIPDDERARRNLARSLARSKRAIEDYIVANQLSKMWTLTCAEKVFSRSLMVEYVQVFFRKWEKYMGRKFAWVWVLEQHKDKSWHCHIGVSNGLYTNKAHLQEMWGHGLVQFDPPKIWNKSNSKSELRRLATYLSKYMRKEFEDNIESGRHRYEVAQGFAPVKVTLRFESKQLAERWLAEMCDGEYSEVWNSFQDDDYPGPPVWVYQSP